MISHQFHCFILIQNHIEIQSAKTKYGLKHKNCILKLQQDLLRPYIFVYLTSLILESQQRKYIILYALFSIPVIFISPLILNRNLSKILMI